MTRVSTEQPSIAVIIQDLRESHARTTAGTWGKGTTTHETVSRTEAQQPYKVADFRHANDAQFCDLVHTFVPRLVSEIETLQKRVQELEAELVKTQQAPQAGVPLPESIPSSPTLWAFLTKGMTLSAIEQLSNESDKKVYLDRAATNWAAIRSECITQETK